ncbi:MAG: aldehyde ferredoxin oxidoreductase C-terminal domain-containing protein [Syntrophales bacterium]|jgi:aldehyde:ferredoxin oxidoreductase|nr:aldehyde ferredoxin oxidoreductase C-terminal domain-containing protein [Syntrophales bacterium]
MRDGYPRGGYIGKLLRVDLSSGKTSDETIDQDLLHQYIGGAGLGIRLLYRESEPGTDPCAPGNKIILVSGPLTGTLVPGSGTISVVSRNSLTGFAAVSQSNGFFGARLKHAGYDGVIIQGRSEKPVYLHIDDGRATLEDAAFLCGKGTFATDLLLRKRHGENGFDDQISVAAIGPAGEHQVRFACISMDRGHIAASGGVGAVMGSKNLKAIVVHGARGISIHPDDKDAFVEKVRQWRQEAVSSGMGKAVNQFGSIAFFTGYHSKGWVPVKNLTTNIFPGEEKFKAEYIRKEIYEGVFRSCLNCTYHHCQTVKVKKGPCKGFVGEEVEYEILAGFGPNWGIYDPGTTTMLNSLNDDLGMDAKEVTFVVSMIMEGYEKGMVSKKALDGLDMKWGNAKAASEMLKKIAAREGVGDLLADGVLRASQKLGGEFPNIAVYVKRGNAPHVHDSRTRWGTLFNQIVSDMGSQEGLDLTGKGSADLGIDKPTSEPDEYLGEVNAKTEWLRQFQECLTYCYYQSASLKTLVETLNILTGSRYTPEDALTIGKRNVALLRMFNCREGMTKEDDSFSPRLQMPPVDGPGKGKSLAPTFEKVRSAYYRAAGWDENGLPTRKLLRELDLEFAIQDKNV